jgi:tetratricopeptide (TPR) repeat protein
MEANLRSLELLPMDDAPAASPAPVEPETIEIVSMDARKPVAPSPAQAAAAGTHTPMDPFAREASRQYAEGHIDQALWDRAIVQSGGDRDKAAATYLAARAVALRLLDRERRQRAREPMDTPTVNGNTAAAEPPASGNDFVPFDMRAAKSKYRNYAIASVVALLLAAGGWVALNRDDGSANSLAAVQPVNTSAALEAAAAEKAKALAAEQAAAVSAKVIPDLIKKIDDLRASGNWNLAVIYLADLVRKDPNNAAYWDELRDGYVHLNQFDDARDAAVKAAERAPSDPKMWRNLGDIYVTQKNSADALAAYTKVVAFDPQDVDSWRHIGLLNARLGHLADAKAAIDHVLAVNPIDSTALCVKPALAQIPADGKDSRAVFMGVEAMEAKCQGASVPVLSAAVK